MERMKVLVTGAAGFIGFHTTSKLLARGDEVVGFDNLNPYYDVRLKEARLARLQGQKGFRFVKADLTDTNAVNDVFASDKFDVVLNLAAQAGVRYSLKNPRAYIDSNIV